MQKKPGPVSCMFFVFILPLNGASHDSKIGCIQFLRGVGGAKNHHFCYAQSLKQKIVGRVRVLFDKECKRTFFRCRSISIRDILINSRHQILTSKSATVSGVDLFFSLPIKSLLKERKSRVESVQETPLI